jgi:hypothetical protein
MALTKVFRIELTGGKDVEKDFLSISKATVAMGKSIAKAKAELAQLVSAKADPAAISSLTAKISDLEAKFKSLSAERKKAETDAKRQAEAEKILADAKLKDAKATKELEQAELARTKNMIAQEKELDRQIDREQKEQAELQKKKKILDGLPGSYNAIKSALAQLKPFVNSGGLGGTANFNGRQLNFDQALAEFKQLSAAEQDFRRQFAKDGTLVGEYASGIVDAFKKLNIDDIIKNQVGGAKEQIGQLETKTKELVVAYRKAQQEGSKDLNKLQKEIHDNVVETQKLQRAVNDAEVQLRSIDGVGSSITSSISEGFSNLKDSIGQFVITFVGFQAAMSSIEQLIGGTATISDQIADLARNLGTGKEQAQGLVDELSKIDTRTTLTDLLDTANIAAKAGVAKSQIVGVVTAIDRLKLVFGDALGDTSALTDSLIKLNNVFGEAGSVSEEALTKTGNAIIQLDQAGTASAPFLSDFAGRVGTIAKAANLTLPSILGLGAGFEELGLSAEVAGTATVTLLNKIAADVDKFSKIANRPVEEFRKILKENPVQALSEVAAGLTKDKGAFEEVAIALKDAGIEASRVTGVITALGTNTEFFAKKIVVANTAIQDTSSIVTAAAEKNNTFGATIEKINKAFLDLSGNKIVQTTLAAIGSFVLFLINSLPVLITLLGVVAAGWGILNAELIKNTLITWRSNLAFKAQYAWLVITETATKAYAIANNFLSGTLLRAAASSTILSSALKFLAGPLGIILTIIGLIGISVVAFGKSVVTAVEHLGEFTRLQRINNEINREALKNTSDQIASIDGWIAVIKSAATSADTKRKALEKLIEINPAFRNALKGQAIDLNELDKAYGKVVQAIQSKARAEAAATLSANKQRKITEIAALRQDIEIQFAQKSRGQSEISVDLSEEQIELLKKSNLRDTGAILAIFDDRVKIFSHRFDDVKKFLDKKEKEAISIYQDYLKAQALAEENLTKAEEQVTNSPTIDPAESVFQIFDRLVANNGTGSDFKELLKKIQEQKKATSVLSKEYQDLLALEKKVRELIKPKAGGAGSSRSPEKQRLDDELKRIDALITERKNALDEQLADGLISERDYYLAVRDNTTQGEQQKINIIQDYQLRYKRALVKYNGELLKEISEAEKKQIQAKRDANQKLFDIDNKQLEINLRNEQNAAGSNKEATLLNPELSYEDQIQATIDYYDRLLLAQIVFNQKQLELEKLYGVKSVENAQKRKEEIDKIRKELEAAERQRPEAQIKDIQDSGDRQVREINIYYSNLRKAILENTKITEKERKRQLEELDKSQRRTVLSAELAQLNIEVKKLEELLMKGLIKRDQYIKAVEAQKKKAEELAGVPSKTLDAFDASFTGFIDSLSNLAGLGDLMQKEIGSTGISIGYVIAQSWDIAKQALQGYFQERQQQIEKEKQERLDELEREKERVKSRASSKAEEETIERQYAQRKKQIDKEAGKELKKQKKAEARIALAAELANIAVQAAANPTNAVSFGAAGIAQFAILSALALGKYLLRISEINNAQFGFGGFLKKKLGLGGNSNEVPINGGVFGGRPHSQGGTDFEFGGRKFNAEVEEMNIIRTRNAPKTGIYSITGSQKQIASALNAIGGGISFATGASVKKFSTGGYLGSTLKAPYFSAGAYLNGGNLAGKVDDDRIERLENMTAQVLQAVYATDKKEVILQPGKVTQAQRKKQKDVSTGTI